MTSSLDFIWLASQSPRRRQLLAQIGVRHELLLPEPHEDAEALEQVLAGELPADYVQRVTTAKLQAAVQRHARLQWPDAPILAADTTVALGRRILGKPDDAAQAREMLTALSGHTHRVLTAVALRAEGRMFSALSESHVHFAPLTPADIEAYIASDEPFGKAGAYAIQGRMAAFVARVEGSYSGIMGLPLYETAELLRQARVRF